MPKPTVEEIEDEKWERQWNCEKLTTKGGHTLERKETEPEPPLTSVSATNGTGVEPTDGKPTSVESQHLKESPQPKARLRNKSWVPRREGRSERMDNKIPKLKVPSNPSQHSLMETKRDWFGEKDPLGVNDIIWEAQKERLAEITKQVD